MRRRCRRSRTTSEFFRPALIWEMLTAPAGAAIEAEQDGRRVLGRDLALDGLRGPLVENVSTGPVGSWRVPMKVDRSAMTSADVLAGHEGHEVQPVRADVADRAERAAALGLQAPVPVAVEEQPVLEVAARHQAHLAEPAVARRSRARAG